MKIICNICGKEKEGVQTGLCSHCGKFGKTDMEIAMFWWNNLSSLAKTQMCDTHTEILFGVRRWETLSGSEIEKIYNCKCEICEVIK